MSPAVAQVAHSLGLTPQALRACASAEDIDQLKKDVKRAYRQRALATHPDRGGNEDEFKQLAAAYSQIEGYLDNISAAPRPKVQISIVDEMVTAAVTLHFGNDWWTRTGV